MLHYKPSRDPQHPTFWRSDNNSLTPNMFRLVSKLRQAFSLNELVQRSTEDFHFCRRLAETCRWVHVYAIPVAMIRNDDGQPCFILEGFGQITIWCVESAHLEGWYLLNHTYMVDFNLLVNIYGDERGVFHSLLKRMVELSKEISYFVTDPDLPLDGLDLELRCLREQVQAVAVGYDRFYNEVEDPVPSVLAELLGAGE